VPPWLRDDESALRDDESALRDDAAV